MHAVVTARAENHIRGVGDMDDTIARLQAYQEVGADVLFAPGLSTADDLRRLVSSVDRPINVLALPATPPVGELAELGVGRVSVGGGFARAALAAVVEAGRAARRGHLRLLGPADREPAGHRRRLRPREGR